MKNIIELLEASKEDLPEIYCDLDQVLVAFLKGADKAVGGSFVNTPKDDRWNKINQTKGFWVNLDWMAGAKRLYQFIANMTRMYCLQLLVVILMLEMVK